MESREDGLCKSNPILIKGGGIENFSEIPGILISTSLYFFFLHFFLKQWCEHANGVDGVN